MQPSTFVLSHSARSLWAKTGSREESNLWSPLYVHLLDAFYVMRYLWDEWLAPSVRIQIADELNADDHAARVLACWIAGVHDIGKATPCFQRKVPERAELVMSSGLTIPRNAGPKSYSHAFMGEIILQQWLKDARGWSDEVGNCNCAANEISSVVGGHHGAPANSGDLQDINRHQQLFPNEALGDENWKKVQDELLSFIFDIVDVDEVERSLKNAHFSTTTLVLLNGLEIMADWIASNADLFPLVDSVDSLSTFKERAARAWKRLALPPAWHPVDQPYRHGYDELFHERFNKLPPSATLRPAQRVAIEASRSMDKPGLLIIEAPMGMGKTEASLLCAEVLASQSAEGGLAYLLPTMATSNAMFSRVERWLELVPDACGVSRQSMQLMHSKAELNSDFGRLCNWGSTWMGDSETAGESVIAHQWFGGRKRGLLASFVVGTVDQLLMAALKTRHVQLRQLGLAGKVVVVDEVHAYDAYMNVYLDRALDYLGAYRVPVILLSATLPPTRREELIRAYRGEDNPDPLDQVVQQGEDRPRRRRSGRSIALPSAPRDASGNPAYPLITVAVRNRSELPVYYACEQDNRQTDVQVSFLPDNEDDLVALLKGLLSDGGCACVLRDTVKRAQQTYDLLCRIFGADVLLVHSRFVAIDRTANDEKLLQLLGPSSVERPERLIVVGTQVLEQSLDIDFDVMVTDVAPIDLLLQRMGRMHRHQRGEAQSARPSKLRQARCFITGADDWEVEPPKLVSGVTSVYEKALLWRSVLAIRGRMNNGIASIRLPEDIAALVEEVYEANGKVPETWYDAITEADDELKKNKTDEKLSAKTWLLSKPKNSKQCRTLDSWMPMDLSLNGLGDEAEQRARAAVRDTQESIEVVVVQRVDGLLYTLPGIEHDEEGHSKPQSSLGSGVDVPDDTAARLAALCTVSLPPMLCAPWLVNDVIASLERAGDYRGWQESRWLKGVLPLALNTDGVCVLQVKERQFKLCYSHERGLEAEELSGSNSRRDRR